MQKKRKKPKQNLIRRLRNANALIEVQKFIISNLMDSIENVFTDFSSIKNAGSLIDENEK